MAINTNTTKSVKKTSNVLGKACEKTGCAEDTKIEKIIIPMVPGSKDDVIFVGLNGVDFYFKRGEKVDVPTPCAEILRDTGNL